MDQDLTFAEGLLEETKAIESRPGYSLVVYEVKANGPKLLAVMAPGELFRPSILRPWAQYEAFRVSAHRGRRLSWAVTVKSRDQLHEFELDIDFGYIVLDPEILVENRDIDPLKQLRGQAERTVKRRVRALPWADIKRGGQSLQEVLERKEAVDHGGTVASLTALEEIRENARRLGLEVVDIAIDRRLSADELVGELAETEAEKERNRFVVELEKQRQQSVLKARGTLDELTEVLQGMLQRAGEGVDSFADMQRSIIELNEIRQQLGRLIQPMVVGSEPSVARGGAPPPVSGYLASGSGGRGSDGLAHLLAEMCGHLGRLRGDNRYRLMATALHLVAETLDEADDGADLDRHRQELLDTLDFELENLQLDRGQVALLRRLVNTDNLRRDLRSDP